MKFVRFGNSSGEKSGVIDTHGALRDLSSVVPDIDAGTLSSAAPARLREIDFATLPAAATGARLDAWQL